MGYDASAYAVFGVPLKQPVFNEIEVKAFAHNFSPEVKFHPQTGKPLYLKRRANIFDGGEDIPGEIAPGIRCITDCRGQTFIGLVAGPAHEGAVFQKLTDEVIGTTVKQVKGLLAKFALSAGPFGMYAIKDESY